jgi:hypothetical protein
VPAGDAGLEWHSLSEQVRERLTAAHLRIDDVLSDRDAAPFHEILDKTKDMAELIDQLRAQLAAQQAVVDAARQAVRGRMGGYVALRETLRALDKAQAAQPEGERLSQ